MKKENNQANNISDLLEENRILKEENDHLKSIHTTLLSEYDDKKQNELLNDFVLREYALNKSIESIITLSSSGEIIYLNESTWIRLGYSKEELYQKHISVLDPNFTPELWPQYWASIKKIKTFSFFSHQRHKDGTLIPVEVTPSYMVYNGIEFCISYSKDVSNIKAAEEIITETELLLSSIIINSSESIALSSIEEEGQYRLMYINNTNISHINKLCKTEYTSRDLVGRLHSDLFLNAYLTSVEELESDNQKRKECIETKERIFYEEALRWGDEIIHLESSITPIFNEVGKCTHTLWTARDITEKKKAEEEKEILFNETLTLNEELKANEEELRQILDSTLELNYLSEQNELKLRAIFDSTESINYLLDIKCNILWYNKPANENIKRRFKKNIVLNTDIKEYMDSYLHDSFTSIFEEALKGETIVNEKKLDTKSTKITWIQTTLIPVYKYEDELIGISMTISDITERKKSEEELKKINKELIYQNEQLNQYSYIVSHNLRGPIASILGLTNVFDSPATNAELKDELIKLIKKSTSHLDTIIKDLNIILSQTKEADHARTLVDLATEVSVIQDLQLPQILKAEATFEIDFSKAPSVLAIKSYINSIFSNLVSNSLKYKKRNLPVKISIHSEHIDNTIIITYSDNGLGIDLVMHKDKIFGFYKRFHTHVEGKGMGLHLVKTQVEIMEGRIEIESEVNKGTTFRIILKNW